MESLYFIRVGGTAMGGVAAACQNLGVQVFGSEEQLYEPMRSYLAEAGVQVFPTFDPGNLAIANPNRVVVGNAVSRGNEELESALEQRRELLSLPQLVGERLIDKNTAVVIAGTHGKTTTTAMTAWLLECAGLQPGFLVGGVPGNFPVSCRPAPPTLHNTERGFFVIEGDEYDSAYFDKRSKFLHYRPHIAVLNNIEFDHADIFENLDQIKRSFWLFMRLVPRNGLVLANGEDANVLDILKDRVSPVETFGLTPDCDWQATELASSEAGCSFEVRYRAEPLGRLKMSMTGKHNVRNMLVASASAYHAGAAFTALQNAAATFVPPKRRMEEVGSWQGALVVEDFGHHPTAVRETLKALATKYPERRIVAAFEPRSNTTTRNIYQRELAECFEEAAAVLIGATDRPWRYDASERLNTDLLVAQLQSQGKLAAAITLEEGRDPNWGAVGLRHLMTWVRPGDLLVLFSNGNFGGLREMVKQP